MAEVKVARRAVEDSRTTSKRSISSTILDFIKMPINRAVGGRQGSSGDTQEHGRGPEQTKKRRVESGGGAEASVVLYEQDGNHGSMARPPVLPLLPLQRLMLLRERQLQRYSQVRALSVDRRSAKGSQNVAEVQLKSTRKKNKPGRQNGVWSADFEYDLEDVPVAIQTHPAKPSSPVTVDVKKFKPAIALASAPTAQLSKGQKDLLVNGIASAAAPLVDSAQGIKINVPSATMPSVKPKVTPTVGFDFITSAEESETNDKLPSPNALQTGNFTSETTKHPALEQKSDTKPAFSFGLPKSDSHKEPEEKKVTFEGKPSTLIFNPEKSLTSKLADDADTEDEPTRKKRFPFAASSESSTEQKPTKQFSFGSSSNEPNAEPLAKKPFTFGSAISKPTEPIVKKEEEDTLKKPAFLLSSTPNDTKPSFSFGAKPETDKEESGKPSFSFGLGKKDTGVKSTPPSLSFGLKNDAKPTEATKAPSFSFGTTNSTEKTATTAPSFQFGGTEPKVKEETNAATGVDKPNSVFSFNLSNALANSTANKSTKPSFSFDKPKSTPTPTPTPTVTPTELSTDTKTNLFSFNTGSGPANPVINPLLTKPANPLLSGGSNITTNAANSGSTFSFMKKDTQPAPAFANQPNAANNNNTPSQGFKFGGSTTPSTAGPTAFSSAMSGMNTFGSNATMNTNSGPYMFGMNSYNAPNGLQPPPPAFNPSSSINLNFANSAVSNPATIFGASTPSPTPSNPGFGFNGMSTSAISTNDQSSVRMGSMSQGHPMQRRLARMRAPRR
ncbi:hypothetical protein TPHA_0P00970 [Tetrapisispora phaffii CBS 4417]|uniref:Uncharacterized protein n=1 Tax=Tetrapisispora phaffii (strain ATCC 24235 / CBS 4417 / NBRC 1672 / NRRL Y-8282 / UCD 70-5) TaxID=1071381 RepID=G8C277_TETPH|nr:hypothetical protein TPHA_0P00970 [Tetrapisispora phaffii CBS 4417]CCE66255.1 hypothetical protein TPHA_0P00970 [Tetrapisispora phaffii CBS 4417]